MPAVTQQIPNFLGGVSRQLDSKKLPGQVTEILNGYPDPAFGLIKRNGSQFLFEAANDTGGLLTDGFWFDINRDDDESYLGVITSAGDIRIWNLIPTLSGNNFTWTECTVNNKSAADVIAYLASTTPSKDLSTVTYADQTYIINKTVTPAMIAGAAFDHPKSWGTVIISLTGGGVYTVTINGTDYNHNAGSGETAEHILNNFVSLFPATGYTYTVHGSSLDIKKNDGTAFTLTVNSGDSAGNMTAYQDTVAAPSFLSADSVHNRRVKILNSLDEKNSYYVKFVAENGVSGDGYWQEDIGWYQSGGSYYLVSAGFNAETMPYKLVNTAKNVFSIESETWAGRLTGDDETCPVPSFIGKSIVGAVLNSNRLAFLSDDSIVLSVAKDISNFFYTTAQTIISSDPIDVDAPSSRVSRLHSAISKPQGLIVFSQYEQFILYSESGNLTPFDSIIRSVGQYENAPDVRIKDSGGYVSFISRTPLSSKVFGMQFRLNDDTPITTELSQVVSGYLPTDLIKLITDPQNSILAGYSPSDNAIYLYKFYSNGQEQLMQAWFKWDVPGDVQYMEIVQNVIVFVTKSGTKYNVSIVSLVQDPFPVARKFGELPTDLTVISASNARLDYSYLPVARGSTPAWDISTAITYNPVTDRSSIPRPYSHIAGRTAVAVVIPQVSLTQPVKLSDLSKLFTVTLPATTQAGYILEIDTTDWTIQGDWTGYEDKLIVGYEFNYEVELPSYYYRQQNQVDWSGVLTIARMKFSVGLTGYLSFYTRKFGSVPWTYVQSVLEAGRYIANSIPLIQDKIFTVPIHQRNDNYQLKVVSTSPFPVTLNSMTWEGNYSTKYYRRA